MGFGEILQLCIALFVICSPYCAIPAFINLTRGKSIQEKRRVGLVSIFSVGVILVGSAWFGSAFLRIIDISVAAFQVSGGFVIFLLALSMLHGQVSKMKKVPEGVEEMLEQESIAVVPLAFPLMAGPGAISSVIVATTTYPGACNQLVISFSAILVTVALGVCLYFAVALEKLLGFAGLNIVGRVGGLLLAALAVETMVKGFIGLFPILGL